MRIIPRRPVGAAAADTLPGAHVIRLVLACVLAFLLPALTLAVERAEQEWASVTRKTAGQAGTVQVRSAVA